MEKQLYMSESHEQQILKHYTQFWGQPQAMVSRELASIPSGRLSIAEFIGDSDRDFYILATIGMSNYPMPYPKEWTGEKTELRAEILLYTDQLYTELPSVLAGLAVYPFAHQTLLGWGHRVPGTHGIIASSPLTDIIFLPALNEPREFRITHFDNGQHVDFLWAVPIYKSEMLFARQHSWQSLVKLFATHQVSAADLHRQSVV